MEPENIKYSNANLLACAVVWHLNNCDASGNPTTSMGIPNAVFEAWNDRLLQMPKDRLMTEQEALEIVRNK